MLRASTSSAISSGAAVVEPLSRHSSGEALLSRRSASAGASIGGAAPARISDDVVVRWHDKVWLVGCSHNY
jgi:hypothetical protein